MAECRPVFTRTLGHKRGVVTVVGICYLIRDWSLVTPSIR